MSTLSVHWTTSGLLAGSNFEAVPPVPTYLALMYSSFAAS